MTPVNARRVRAGKEIRTASPILRGLFQIARERGIRINDIGQAIGCSKTAISNWRRGETEPGVMTVEEMAAKLGYRIVLEKIE